MSLCYSTLLHRCMCIYPYGPSLGTRCYTRRSTEAWAPLCRLYNYYHRYIYVDISICLYATRHHCIDVCVYIHKAPAQARAAILDTRRKTGRHRAGARGTNSCIYGISFTLRVEKSSLSSMFYDETPKTSSRRVKNSK